MRDGRRVGQAAPPVRVERRQPTHGGARAGKVKRPGKRRRRLSLIRQSETVGDSVVDSVVYSVFSLLHCVSLLRERGFVAVQRVTGGLVRGRRRRRPAGADDAAAAAAGGARDIRAQTPGLLRRLLLPASASRCCADSLGRAASSMTTVNASASASPSTRYANGVAQPRAVAAARARRARPLAVQRTRRGERLWFGRGAPRLGTARWWRSSPRA